MACMVLALAFFGIVFIIQATTEEHNGFLRVNSRDDVSVSIKTVNYPIRIA